jgi:hypothetical protein
MDAATRQLTCSGELNATPLPATTARPSAARR